MAKEAEADAAEMEDFLDGDGRWQRGGKRRLALPIPLIRFLSSMRLASTNQALRETYRTVLSPPSFSIQYILGRKSWLFFALRPTPYFPPFPIFRGRKKYHAGEPAAIRVRNAFSFHGFFPPLPLASNFCAEHISHYSQVLEFPSSNGFFAVGSPTERGEGTKET